MGVPSEIRGEIVAMQNGGEQWCLVGAVKWHGDGGRATHSQTQGQEVGFGPKT